MCDRVICRLNYPKSSHEEVRVNCRTSRDASEPVAIVEECCRTRSSDSGSHYSMSLCFELLVELVDGKSLVGSRCYFFAAVGDYCKEKSHERNLVMRYRGTCAYLDKSATTIFDIFIIALKANSLS